MSDITKCRFIGCPIKDKCYRHTAKSSYMQSWFVDNPSEIKDGVFSCDMFWGDGAQSQYDLLKEIVKLDEENEIYN